MYWVSIAVLALSCSSALATDPDQPSNGPLRELRFSPDGRYVLAQDSAAITVLTVHPFEVSLRIHDSNAATAQFTPDSRDIVFLTSHSRGGAGPGMIAERWNVEDATRTSSKEFFWNCGSAALSPDGETWACVDDHGTFRLLDLASGRILFEKRNLNKLGPDERGWPCMN